MNGTLVQPSFTTSFDEMNDPKRRPKFTQLLGFTAVTPEEPLKGNDSQAPTPENGTDHPEGTE
jgi:hypothetical protein